MKDPLKQIILIVLLQLIFVAGLGFAIWKLGTNTKVISYISKHIERSVGGKKAVLGSRTTIQTCIAGLTDTPYPTGSDKNSNSVCKNLEEDVEKVTKDISAVTTSVTAPTSFKTEAWIYPGPPACNAMTELKVRGVHTVKVEYFSLNDTGRLNTLTTANAGCNAYSAANVATLKLYTKAQYVTVSGAYDGIHALVNNSSLRTAFVNKLTSFVVNNNLTGIDIDFEQVSSWSATDYANFKYTMRLLGNSLHAKGKKLQIDLPPIGNLATQRLYLLKYEDFNALPVDQYTIMAYDYQYDYGSGTPVQPISWLNSIIDWAKAKFIYDSRISIGVPAYGYKGICNSYNMSILTYNQIKVMPGFSTARRDTSSYEMKWKSGSYCYNYSDTTSLNSKLNFIKTKGITTVSVWHLGGNLWFSK